jgi:hypothetical protein
VGVVITANLANFYEGGTRCQKMEPYFFTDKDYDRYFMMEADSFLLERIEFLLDAKIFIKFGVNFWLNEGSNLI